jgi:hypothetical protein
MIITKPISNLFSKTDRRHTGAPVEVPPVLKNRDSFSFDIFLSLQKLSEQWLSYTAEDTLHQSQ